MSLSQNGLFSRAQNAADKYKKAQEDEEDLIEQLAKDMEILSEDYSKYIGAKVTGYNPVTKTGDSACTIGTDTSGHTEAQDFTTDDNMSWRIWDYDGRTLRIIGDPTQDPLTLSGAAGYNNGVWAIEEICKECYSNNKLGVEVTSLKRTDIQKVSSYDYTKYKHKQSGNDAWREVTDNNTDDKELIYFGEIKTYTTNNKYPKMWNDKDQNWTYKYDKGNNTTLGGDQECTIWEDKGIGEGQMSGDMIEGSSATEFKQSYYLHDYKEEEFPNKKYYDLIFKKSGGTSDAGSYWLAGRCVYLDAVDADFGMQYVNSSKDRVQGTALCTSNDDKYNASRTIRPLVSINLNLSKCTITPKYRRKWKYCVM